MLGRYCNNIPNITSTHNKIYLWFRTDHSNARGGFALTWNSTDPGTLHVYLILLPYSLVCFETTLSGNQYTDTVHTMNHFMHYVNPVICTFISLSLCLYLCFIHMESLCLCTGVYKQIIIFYADILK